MALHTEVMLLGVVSLRAGKKLEYDAPNMRVTNVPATNVPATNEFSLLRTASRLVDRPCVVVGRVEVATRAVRNSGRR